MEDPGITTREYILLTFNVLLRQLIHWQSFLIMMMKHWCWEEKWQNGQSRTCRMKRAISITDNCPELKLKHPCFTGDRQQCIKLWHIFWKRYNVNHMNKIKTGFLNKFSSNLIFKRNLTSSKLDRIYYSESGSEEKQ